MSKKFAFYALICFTCPCCALAQGKLVLIGGGSESEGGWSDAPYAWVVAHSENKKVAVISYTDADDFIPDYLISLGALSADNIRIDSRELADLQDTYDSLMKYDALFFKGGDQSFYYDYYKDTKIAEAIVDKFNAGGVIGGASAGMAILSGVIFTAENGSVYPDEALLDFKHTRIALADDFLPLFPGFIFDSHFTERGRVGRLLPFMANWFLNNDELITGIGVDDRTALCIDDDKKATVFGTGSVSFYSASTFSAAGTRPLADSVYAVQLLHGNEIDLTNLFVISGPENEVIPEVSEVSGNYTVMLSGSEGLSANTSFINHFLQAVGNPSDTIVVVTGVGRGKNFIQRLMALGANAVVLETLSTANDPDKIDLRNAIRKSKKVLFVENSDDCLFNFLHNGPTGHLLIQHLRRNNMISGFIGEDSRYAGKVWVVNHLTDGLAAYYGKLQYRQGLNLLGSTVIMSNTYDATDADFYENTTAAVSYALINEALAYGVYLNRNSFLKFYPQSGKSVFQSFGELSTMVLVNDGTLAELASQPVNAGGDVRNYVGFSSLQYVLLNGETVIPVGNIIPSIDTPHEQEVPIVGLEREFDRSSAILFPNPSNNGIFSLSSGIPVSSTLSVTDMLGRKVLQDISPDSHIDLSSYPDGIYVITIRSGDQIRSVKGIKSGQRTR